MKTIFKKATLIISAWLLVSFSGGALATWGNDFGCIASGSYHYVAYDNADDALLHIDLKTPNKVKSDVSIASGATWEVETYWKGQYGGIGKQANRRSYTNKCVGGCGPECGNLGKFLQHGAVDCFEHDYCGMAYDAQGLWGDPNCGKEAHHGDDDFILTALNWWESVRCRWIWR